jgi:hypothetical protein
VREQVAHSAETIVLLALLSCGFVPAELFSGRMEHSLYTRCTGLITASYMHCPSRSSRRYRVKLPSLRCQGLLMPVARPWRMERLQQRGISRVWRSLYTRHHHRKACALATNLVAPLCDVLVLSASRGGNRTTCTHYDAFPRAAAGGLPAPCSAAEVGDGRSCCGPMDLGQAPALTTTCCFSQGGAAVRLCPGCGYCDLTTRPRCMDRQKLGLAPEAGLHLATGTAVCQPGRLGVAAPGYCQARNSPNHT